MSCRLGECQLAARSHVVRAAQHPGVGGGHKAKVVADATKDDEADAADGRAAAVDARDWGAAVVMGAAVVGAVRAASGAPAWPVGGEGDRGPSGRGQVQRAEIVLRDQGLVLGEGGGRWWVVL